MKLVADQFLDKAQQLAKQYGFEVVPECDDAHLRYDNKRLALSVPEGKKQTALSVDFLEPGLQRRINWKQLKSELILKACAVTRDQLPSVLDATAGFGVDSFLLAAAGADVTMLERSPIMAALLADGLERMNAYPHQFKMKLIHADAITYLAQCDTPFEVIYLDPMHPERRSAAVNQSMRVLREHVGEDTDFKSLFEIALSHATKRVVVKWPMKAPSDLPKPDFAYEARAIRFDCYAK